MIKVQPWDKLSYSLSIHLRAEMWQMLWFSPVGGVLREHLDCMTDEPL